MRSSKYLVTCAVFCLARLCDAQQSSVTTVRLLAQRLHAAYGARDVDRVVALWSDHSPERVAAREQALKWFARSAVEGSAAEGSAVQIRETTVRDPEISGDLAYVRIDREITAPGMGGSGPGVTSLRLVLKYVNEHGEWKIWKETPASEDLSIRLLAASTDKEQAGLLSTNEDLPGSDLATALIERGREARNRGDSERALKSFGLAQAVAERASAPQTEALAVNGAGLVYFDRGDYAEALNWYQKSLAISESSHDDRGAARSLTNIGALYSDVGESSLAWENFQKGLRSCPTSQATWPCWTTSSSMALLTWGTASPRLREPHNLPTDATMLSI